MPRISLAQGPDDRSTADSLMKQGNQSYQDKKYDQAVDDYQKVIDMGFTGRSLYYNLGNSYYRVGKLGLAILFYEKALRISPGDDDVIHNLAIANAKTVDKIDALPRFFIFQWWESALALFSLRGWTNILYALYILLLLSIGAYFFARRTAVQRLSVYAGLVSAFLLIVVGVVWGVNVNRTMTVKDAVVTAPTATVKLSPDPSSNDAFVVHEGLKVRELDKVDTWIRIRLQDGKQGWIQQDEIGTI